MSLELARRVALLKLAEDEADRLTFESWLKEQSPSKAREPLSETVLTRLRARLGRPAMQFFKLYGHTRQMFDGAPPPEDGLVQAWRVATKVLVRSIAARLGDRVGPELINTIFDRMSNLRPLLKKIEQGYGTVTYRTVGEQLGQIIADVCKAAGIPVTLRPGPDAVRWPLVRRSTKREQQLERLQETDSALYEQIIENRENVRKREEQIVSNIERAGLLPTRSKIRGKVVNVGVDPVTNERLVYTNDGRVISSDQFSEEMAQNREQEARSTRVFPNGLPIKSRPTPSLSGLRSLSDEQLENPDVVPSQEIAFRALTDDAAADPGIRIYPTKMTSTGQVVVVDGRFKGIFLDDLVNQAGRLIEGAAYDFDQNGKRVKFETKNPDGSPNLMVRKEPYVTLTTDGRFMVKIPFKGRNDPFTQARNEMSRLAKPTKIPTIEKVEGTMSTTFIFPEKDFAAVRTAIKGMVMSKAAAEKMEAYFDQLARQERALTEEATKSYSLSQIGGFKIKNQIDPEIGEPFDPPKFAPDLFTKQKQAISWLESKGFNGLVALDTGIGKCVKHDTLICTDRGLVPIRDMNPGLTIPDTQANVDGWSVLVGGERLPVIAFYYAGMKPTLRVRTRNGYEIEGSLIHPVMVRRASGEDFVRTPDLRVGDFLCIERFDSSFPTEEPALQVPTPSDIRTVIFDVPDRMNPDLARLLGYIIAEGWVKHGRFFTISQDPNYNPEVNSDIVSLARSQLSYLLDGSEKDKVVSSKFLRTYLEWMGVDYTLSADKCIPPVIMQSTRDSVIGFIQAYVDAEGSVCDSGLEVSSASERLLREVQILLLRLGIVSSRRPKKVSGRDHTYWRLQITGDNLRRYRDVIGMISSRKAQALNVLCERDANTNTDITPHAKDMVEALRNEIFIRAGGQGKGGGLIKRFGNSFVHTLTHIRQERRNPSERFLRQMLSIAEAVGAQNTSAFVDMKAHVERRYFYDPIESITEGFCEVMDIEVGDPRHTFIGNGVVNHNTLTTIATMKKMDRDGFALEGERFLYVCPTKLRGNFTREARAYVKESTAFLSRVDVLSYHHFIRRRTQNPKFGTREGDPEAGVPPYAAVFFDEAHALMKSPRSKASQAAQKLNHPRKILLTASPMEDDPDELYVGVAITNNIDLNEPVPPGQVSPAIRDMMRFRSRFCQVVGGRTLGLKPADDADPTKIDDFRVWAKSNFFAANKRDVIEKPLPELRRDTMTLTMSPEVERVYREVASSVVNVLQDAIRVYKDREHVRGEELRHLFGMKLKKQLTKLNDLANMPGILIPGTQSPKIMASTGIVFDRIARGGRTLLFTDSPKFAEYTVSELSARIPSLLHGVALAGEIAIYQNGNKVKKYTERRYKTRDGVEIPKTEWASFVLRDVLGADPQVVSITLTSGYTLGQNLQMFSTVIHLDRDSFSSEMMKQRTARAWRTGQNSAVDEITLDMAYEDPVSESDHTLDELRKFVQTVQEQLFDEIVGKSQSAAIGKDWSEMVNVDASLVAVNRRLLEMTLTPLPSLMGMTTPLPMFAGQVEE